MKLYSMILLVLLGQWTFTEQVKRVPKSLLSLNKPLNPVFAPNPYAWIVKSITLSVVIGYVICYFFIGPVSPLLMGSKPLQHSFGLRVSTPNY